MTDSTETTTTVNEWECVYQPRSLKQIVLDEIKGSRLKRPKHKLEPLLLNSDYIWGDKERKKTVTSLIDLNKQEKQRAALAVMALIIDTTASGCFTHFSRKPENILCLYLFGSRVWGTVEELSDWDFVLVVKDYTEPVQRNLYAEIIDVNVCIFTQSLFHKQVQENRLDVLPLLYLPEQHIWYKEEGIEWPFSIVPELLCASVQRETDRTQFRAASDSMTNFRRAKKFLLHSLRYLSFATQVLEKGKVERYDEMNYLWPTLQGLEFAGWNSFLLEKYLPEYKRLRNKFRVVFCDAVLKRPPGEQSPITVVPLKNSWRKQSNWLRSALSCKKASYWTRREYEEGKFSEAQKERIESEEQYLWTSVFYPKFRTTLRMQCVDTVVETLLSHYLGKTKKEDEDEDDDGSWKSKYENLPADLKELLLEELMQRQLALPELVAIFNKPAASNAS